MVVPPLWKHHTTVKTVAVKVHFEAMYQYHHCSRKLESTLYCLSEIKNEQAISFKNLTLPLLL